MLRVFQIFGVLDNIKSRMSLVAPQAAVSYYGLDMDYTMEVEASQQDLEYIYDEFEEEIYGDGEFTLAGTLVEMLRDAGLKLATAESCTGGMVAGEIVGIPGASDVFYEGLVTYSNESKMARLGVGFDTLCAHGAVSEQTAKEMAIGLLGANATIGLSTTGIAGPGGGSEDKPVGLVYMAVAGEKGGECYRHIFSGERNEVRKQACNAIMFHAIQHIKNHYRN